MKISETCIQRPVFASMMIAALVVFGLTAYRTIGVDLYPDVDIPIVTVTVPYTGADPETVETEVTDKIEEAVNTISGVKTLRSESIEGLAQVFIEFELEENIDVVSQEVRDKVSGIRGDLPLEIDPPVVEKFDIDSSPIMAIVISGSSPIRELTRYADDVVKPRVESVSGVGNVRLVGDREREVRIWLRADELRAHGLTARNVIDTLREENLEPPGGRVETQQREIIVKTKGKVERVAEFKRADRRQPRRHTHPAPRRRLGGRRDGRLPKRRPHQRPTGRVAAGPAAIRDQHAAGGRRREAPARRPSR